LPFSGLGDDFLVKEGAAAAFDDVETRIHFVRAINRDIDGRRAFLLDERETGFGGDAGDLGRRGEAADAGEFAGGMAAEPVPRPTVMPGSTKRTA
jgi:hypothetical protein